MRILPLLAVSLALPVLAQNAPQNSSLDPVLDPSVFGGLKARAIGTAHTSGRISAIDATTASPQTIFVGTASGGVWRSTDSGTTFKPVFDDFTQSIGALRLDPSNAKTLWVGTGEAAVRNSVSIGTGVYVSRDGGDSFQAAGLDQVERIAEIEVSHLDSNVVYVCATGALWSDSDERGVYRSQDAGKSWQQVLKVDARTGCSDLAIDPKNPNVLYAGMWSFRRSPDFFTSGGPGSGLYRSFDAGSTWQKIEQGLPTGEKGRIGLAIAASRTNTVYALVESKKTALFRSDDMGNSWRETNSSSNVQVRPFYFGVIEVDPTDPERVYRPALFTTTSSDGGKTFNATSFGGSVHPDHHALWINPNNPEHLILGTDGGVYISFSRGSKWEFVRSLPVSQFYHVSADMQTPYNVYGGLQDNGSWTAPSRAAAGIRNRDWHSVGFGDGFWVWPDPKDNDIVYSQYQGGKMLRVHRKLGEVKRIAPSRGEGEQALRFNWNTPVVVTPDGVMYAGSQYLHRSSDRGDTWARISPDLTSNDPKRQRQDQSGGLTRDNSTAENNTTLYTIAVSPKQKDLIWVGTDDGKVQLTRDGGKSWEEQTKRLPGLAAGTWISRIEASAHDPAVAFVTVDDHRRGDMQPHVYRTDSFGQSWRKLPVAGVEGYAWVIAQDPVQASLLYLGTEFGLYISIDGGQRWTRFSEGLPKVAVHDLFVHPRDGDLVIGTHGRGVYIVDDLTPLRALTREVLAQPIALLPSRDSVQWASGALQDFGGDDEFNGTTGTEAAVITFYQSKRHVFGDLKLEVYDADGKLITTLPVEKRRGMVRVEWPMRLPPPKLPASTQLVPAFFGPRVPEGSYRFVLIKDKQRLESQVELVADPRSAHSKQERKAQQDMAMALYRELSDLTYLAESIADLRKQIAALSNATDAQPKRSLSALDGDLLALSQRIAASSTDGGYVSGEKQLRERMGELYGDIVAYDGRPTDSQSKTHLSIQAEYKARSADAEALFARLDAINKDLAKPLIRLDRASWEKRSQGVGGSTQMLRALPNPLSLMF